MRKVTGVRAELLFSFFLFYFTLVFSEVFSPISSLLLFDAALFTGLFLVYLAAYFTDNEPARKASFVLLIATFLLGLAVSGYLLKGVTLYILTSLVRVGVHFVLFLPLFFLAVFGTYLVARKNYGVGIALFLLMAIVLAVYYLSGYVYSGYQLDDETVLSLLAVKSLLLGINPYTTSASSYLYLLGAYPQQHAFNSSVSITVTTRNTVVGVMDYPALYFLSFMPFYFAAAPTLYNLARVDLLSETVAFMFILIVVIAYLFDRKELLGIKLGFIALFALFAVSISSVTTYLMLAIILAAYYTAGRRYSWLFLGLALSLQEELWVPALLLIAYTFNTFGMKKGFRDLAGSAAVFLLINGYFIATNPMAYYNAVFTPLNSLLLPAAGAPFGYLLVHIYPLLLSAYPKLFALAALAMALILLCSNRKELIPILSMIPLMFMARAFHIYYVFFLIFFACVLYGRREAHRQGIFRRLVGEGYPAMPLAGIAAIVSAGILIAYYSHAAYLHDFNVSITNQSIRFQGDSTVYSGYLHYGDLSNGTVYLLIDGFANNSATYDDLFNQSILQNRTGTPCGSYVCHVNVNVIQLPRNGSVYHITAIMNWTNAAEPVLAGSAAIYNGEYFYISRGTYNLSAIRSG